MGSQPLYDPSSGVTDWLLAGDPSVRWQVMADLLDAPAAAVSAARARVATEGWGAELLARQDPDGRWVQSLYSRKYTSTTYTLLLQRLGLPAGKACADRRPPVVGRGDVHRWWPDDRPPDSPARGVHHRDAGRVGCRLRSRGPSRACGRRLAAVDAAP